MSSMISQLSCFTSVNHNFRLRHPPLIRLTHNSKFSLIAGLDGRNADSTSSSRKVSLSYRADLLRSSVTGTSNAYSTSDEQVDGNSLNGPIKPSATEEKRAAKIHDFCFGIPFGSIVLMGGLFGFIFSRNLNILGMGALFGGAILALSTISLKVWRQGKSSFPFILGQAVLSAAFFWKNFQVFSSTGKLFPSGLYAVMSAAMLSFYSYVVFSGGNPPPKKLKSATNVA